MDSNGLADPYVKLHLLPGASKVRLCQVWCWGWSRGFSNPPQIRFSLLISPLAAVFPGGFSKPRCSPRPEEQLILQAGICSGMEGSSRGGIAVNASQNICLKKSDYCQGWNYPFAWKLQHVLVGAVGREPGGKLWLHHGNS